MRLSRSSAEELALALAQIARDDHVEHHPLVAAAAAANARHAAPAQGDHGAGLGAGGHLDLLVAVERGHAHGRAERRRRGGHVDHGHQVVAVAQEALVLAHVDQHVQIAGRAAALARVAAAREPDALVVGDAGRARPR